MAFARDVSGDFHTGAQAAHERPSVPEFGFFGVVV